MKKRGVQCTKGVFKPLHRYLDLSPKRFPYTEEAMMRGASLPIYPGLTKEEFRRILDAAREAL
jgi:dTDP-4-amino-4,6-dideoxygalactose transaminase